MEDKIYIAIDLKSFYASVECKERGLDPLTTNLVVADSREDRRRQPVLRYRPRLNVRHPGKAEII